MSDKTDGIRTAATILVAQRNTWLADAMLLPDNALLLRHQAATANALAQLLCAEANRLESAEAQK